VAFILGLDISTSNVGWCILDENSGRFIDAAAVLLSKIKCVFQKAEEVRVQLEYLNSKYDIRSITIEENLQAFRPGFSSAKTIVTLARFNGMVSLMSYDVFGMSPAFINVNHARKVVGLKIDRKAEATTKEQVLDFARRRITDNFQWPMRTIKSGKRKGLVLFADSCYDISDAYVIASSCVKNE
jgi:Holliday junction resolvasome RuvABC endonuclease subunit